jgi:hypothetical protein
MGWIRRFWPWVKAPIGGRHRSSQPIIRTPLDLFDEAIGDVESYITYLEMELVPEEPNSYLHDEEVWTAADSLASEILNLQAAVNLIEDVIARLEEYQAARSGQGRASEADA